MIGWKQRSIIQARHNKLKNTMDSSQGCARALCRIFELSIEELNYDMDCCNYWFGCWFFIWL